MADRRNVKPRAPKKSESASARVYQALREAILAHDLPPDTDLLESQIVKDFRVSRTPAREALIRLASEGLVVLSPNKGGRVTSLTLKNVLDHLEAMDIFEPTVCYLAAWRRRQLDLDNLERTLSVYRASIDKAGVRAMIQANYHFHECLCLATQNASIIRAYQQILIDKLRIAQHGALRLGDDGIMKLKASFTEASTIYEHLVELVRNGDRNAAREVGRQHSAFVRRQFIGVIAYELPDDTISDWEPTSLAG